MIVFALQQSGVLNGASYGAQSAAILFLRLLISLNVMMFVFNLLPLPPLDGYRILQEFLPLKAIVRVQRYEQWVVYLFLLLFFIPPLRAVTFGPLLSLQGSLINWMFRVGAGIFGVPLV
jgi:Zn-dependent protease